jgi:hypothetical protein
MIRPAEKIKQSGGEMKDLSAIKVSLLIVLLFSVILITNGSATAATYYVSPSGSDSGPGTSSSPWKTLQKCATTMNGGDTCIAKDGTYSDKATGFSDRIMNLTSRISGSSGSWTTFKSENKWGAVIDGSSLTGNNYGVMINQNVSYVRFEDFDFTGMRRGIHDGFGSSSYIYIKGNRFRRINYKEDCNYWGGTYTIGAGPIYTKEPYTSGFNAHWTLDSNLFYENGRTPSTSCPEINYNHDHFWYANGHYNTAINNIFMRAHAGWSIVMSNGATNFTIVNNTFYGSNPGREGFIYGDSNNVGCSIENNIFYADESGDEYALRNDGTDAGSSFKNNLLFNAEWCEQS